MAHYTLRMNGFRAGRRAGWRSPGLRRVAALSAVVFAVASGRLEAETDRLVRSFTLRPDQPIVVDATVAEITIQGWDRSDVTVEIVRTAPSRELLARLPIVFSDDASPALRVGVVQLEDGKDPRLRATLTLSVPRRARLERIRVFEGRLSLSQLSGGIHAVINRGPIQASRLDGSIRLETTIGAIDLNHVSLSPGGLLRLRTFNGSVRLALDERPVNARILALTLNGRITSDIPLERKDQFGPRFAGAILGTGEPLLSIDVVTGDIRIDVGGR
ncbi:MAG: hypothetical protein HYZ58_10070 [Acidobacteria bacterium]|nr:hypothetical protein [Acidobacteriota bacterium]